MMNTKRMSASLALWLAALLVPAVAARRLFSAVDDADADVLVPDELCDTWVGGFVFRNQTTGKSDYSSLTLAIGSDGSVWGHAQPILKPGMEFTTDIAAIETTVASKAYTANTTSDECCVITLKKGGTSMVFNCGFDLVCPESKKSANVTGWGKKSKGVLDMEGITASQ